MKAIIFHGTNGSPKEHWFPWLQEKLTEQGYDVFVPQLPIDEQQTISGWMNAFAQTGISIDEETILIGHSLGCPFILHLLEKYPCKAVFLAGGFCSPLEGRYKEIVSSFVQTFDFETIQKNCTHFFVYGSDDDTKVPLEHVKALAIQLNVAIILTPGLGHYQIKTFETLLKDINEVST